MVHYVKCEGFNFAPIHGATRVRRYSKGLQTSSARTMAEHQVEAFTLHAQGLSIVIIANNLAIVNSFSSPIPYLSV